MCYVVATPVVTSRGSLGSVNGTARSYLELVNHSTGKHKGSCNIVRDDDEDGSRRRTQEEFARYENEHW